MVHFNELIISNYYLFVNYVYIEPQYKILTLIGIFCYYNPYFLNNMYLLMSIISLSGIFCLFVINQNHNYLSLFVLNSMG